jgi:glutamine---fructose-6-phosphate transaminase (isomerizing)
MAGRGITKIGAYIKVVQSLSNKGVNPLVYLAQQERHKVGRFMTNVRDNIFEQPDILHAAAERNVEQAAALAPFAERIRSGAIDKVILTGMGGSFAALFPSLLTLIRHGIPAYAIESSELLYDYRALITERTLIVAASQSGESVEVVRLLEQGASTQVIGVTNSPDSTLTRQSSAALLIGAGDEATVATKTYTATVAGLAFVTAGLAGEPLSALADALHQTADYIAATLSTWETLSHELVAAIEPARFIVFVGRGAGRASALNGALAVKETAKVPTEGMVTGQFRHGPMEVLGEGVIPFIFMGTGQAYDLHAKLARDLEAKGSRVVCVGTSVADVLSLPVVPPQAALLQIAEVVPIQLFAAALAAGRGIVPGTFYHGAKVTTVE